MDAVPKYLTEVQNLLDLINVIVEFIKYDD
jgi:hypothetical protein